MTAQMHETLILNGHQTSMACCPDLPRRNTRIVQIYTGQICTACWRGYVGTWEIRDTKLYLVELGGRYKIIGPGPIFAGWYSGMLRVPRGKMLPYVHAGFESIYEHELHISIDHGHVTCSRLVHNRGKLEKRKALSRALPFHFDDLEPDATDCDHARD